MSGNSTLPLAAVEQMSKNILFGGQAVSSVGIALSTSGIHNAQFNSIAISASDLN